VQGTELPWLDDIDAPKRPARLPVVLNRERSAGVLAAFHGTSGLIPRPLDGTGMRIVEARKCPNAPKDWGWQSVFHKDVSITMIYTHAVEQRRSCREKPARPKLNRDIGVP
jgi:hypothetical protein